MSNPVPTIPASTQIVSTRGLRGATPIVAARGQLPNASGTLYTAPSPTTPPVGSIGVAALMSIVLNNCDSSARTVTLYLIESGGSVADNRAIVKAASIPANTMVLLNFGDKGIPLEAAETIRGLASVADVVTYRIHVDIY